jgi:hypothetical protein
MLRSMQTKLEEFVSIHERVFVDQRFQGLATGAWASSSKHSRLGELDRLKQSGKEPVMRSKRSNRT